MKTFNHNYNASTDIERIAGYTECLDALFETLRELTQFKPEKRLVDAVELLDKITGTNEELGKVLHEIRGDLTLESFTTKN